MFNKTSSQNIQINSLDGLRGLAMLFVLLSHISSISPIMGVFNGIGKYGVYLFFTLSSFLLSLPLLQKEHLFNPKVWLHYFKRRFTRIYPLFFIVLFVCYLYPSQYLALSLSQVVKHLLLLDGQGVFWSIAVEFKFYFILPFFILAFRLLKNNPFYCSLISIALLSGVEYLWPRSNFEVNSFSLIPYAPIFVFGVLAALFYLKLKDQPISIKYILEGIAVLCFLTVLATAPFLWGFEYNHFHHNYLFYALTWSIMIISFLKGSGMIRLILSFKAMRFMGLISFSVYLWHPFVITLIRNAPIPAILQAALVIPLTFVLSYISYMVVERPFLLAATKPM